MFDQLGTIVIYLVDPNNFKPEYEIKLKMSSR